MGNNFTEEDDILAAFGELETTSEPRESAGAATEKFGAEEDSFVYSENSEEDSLPSLGPVVDHTVDTRGQSSSVFGFSLGVLPSLESPVVGEASFVADGQVVSDTAFGGEYEESGFGRVNEVGPLDEFGLPYIGPSIPVVDEPFTDNPHPDNSLDNSDPIELSEVGAGISPQVDILEEQVNGTPLDDYGSEVNSELSLVGVDPYKSPTDDLEDVFLEEVVRLPEVDSLPFAEELPPVDIDLISDGSVVTDFSQDKSPIENVLVENNLGEFSVLDEVGETEEGVDKVNPLEESDSDGEVNLNPVVTPDGRTLDEMILGIRSGATTIDKKLKEVKEGLSETVINGKVKSDNRYTKHGEALSRKKTQGEKRIAASKKYIQKNSRYTEEEKLIMRSLGLDPKEMVAMVSPNSKLNDVEKAKMLQAGTIGEERYFKGRRFRATVGDMDIIQFLAKFKFASVRILSRLRSEPQGRTWRKLTRLKRGGLVYDAEIIGMGTVWSLTEIGMSMSGYQFKTWRQKAPKVSTLPPIIGINHIAACLWNNEQNVLGLEDFPSVNRRVHKAGEPALVRGESLVSELELRSSLSKEMKPTFDSSPGFNYYNQVGETARALFHEWEVGGKVGPSPEFEIGQEFCWVLFPNSGLTRTFHVPDLVLARDRAEDGSPRSIAVELELNAKTVERYKGILMSYKLDEHLYEKVIWVTNNNSIAKKLIEAAEAINLTKFDVIPVINEHGIYKDRDIWHI